MNSILEAHNVSFAYGPAKWAIRELSFSLPRPERVALLGSNGVGKSTLMLMLNGTLRPQAGELFVLGRPIDYSRAGLHRLRREVGMVLQDPDDQLFGATVEQDVAFGPLNNGMSSNQARALVDETLSDLGISHLAERPIHELSLGEKKRVAIAGVLVLRPRIILLDEPTAGLDFAGICAMLALLKKLHQQGATLVISTHDTDLAFEWANEAWVLGDGRVAAQGPIGEVMQDRATLHQAHLKVPWVVELGLAVRETYPDLSGPAMPATQDELIQLIQQIRLVSAAQPVAFRRWC
jgi:cobalt/nickel transport system ATP-binding protein